MHQAEPDREQLRQLFVAYHAAPTEAVRDELVAGHLRLAVHLAKRFANRGVPTEDLIQVASLALIHAVERFDPTRGLEFSTFATPTIVGELKRHFRDKGWSVRVPRRVQDLNVRLGAIVGDLTQQLGRSPTIAELARAARSSEEEVLEAMEAARAYRAASLSDADPDEEWNDGRAPTSALGHLDPNLFEAENRVVIDRLLVELPAREQLMIQLRFYDEMSQREIADRLGISQMHVSRLLARSLDHLRRLVDDEGATNAGQDHFEP